MDQRSMLIDPLQDSSSLRETIRKTAKYVVNNGDSFQEKLGQDPRFSFVIPGDEHFSLYQEILNQERNSRASNDELVKQQAGKNGVPQQPYVFSFSIYDENIAQRDLEIIKLAAAYCVANENHNYLEKMRHYFEDDELFAFLSPNHALYDTFIQFVNQYKHVKSNSHDPPYLEWKDGDYKFQILQRSFQRAEFDVYSGELKAKKDKALHQQKVHFAAFDWTSFKVVDKVTLPASNVNDLPAQLDFNKLRLKTLENVGIDSISDKLEEGEPKKGSKSKKRKLKAAGATRLKMRQMGRSTGTELDSRYIECPITHRMISEDRFDKHLQVLLADPHYKVEREKYEAKHKLTNLSSTEVYENIKRIAKTSDHSI